MLDLSAPSTTYGAGATGLVTVAGADSGTVTVGVGGTSTELPLVSGQAKLLLALILIGALQQFTLPLVMT